MFLGDIKNKYKILYNSTNIIEKGPVTHDLGSTSGETLISDRATLDCKEQLGYSNHLVIVYQKN